MAGRVAYTGGIVRNGLVLHLDAAKRDSYPKTGTLWTDLSGNGNIGTLTNSPTYNSGNGGSIQFDGTNQYVNFGILNSINSLTTFSVDVWLNSNSTTEQMFISTTNTTGTKGWHTEIYNGKPLLQVYPAGSYKLSTTILSTNTWYNVCFTYASPTNISIYINGVITTTTDINGSTFTFTASDYNTHFGYFPFGVAKYPFSGKNSIIKIYNRALTATEITQNYNALKGRYI